MVLTMNIGLSYYELPLIILGVDWLLNVSAFSIQDRLRLHLAYLE